MTRPDYWKDCTIECERQVVCVVCHRTKPPVGRDVATRDGGYCDHECHGRHMKPIGGHLWPGELASMKPEPAPLCEEARESALRTVLSNAIASPRLLDHKRAIEDLIAERDAAVRQVLTDLRSRIQASKLWRTVDTHPNECRTYNAACDNHSWMIDAIIAKWGAS